MRSFTSGIRSSALKLPGARYILEINFVMFIAGFSMFLADVAIVYFAQTPPPVGFGLNTFETALIYVPSGIAVLVASPLFGVLVTRRGAKNTLVFASFIVAASFVFFALADSSIVGIIIGTIILFSGRRRCLRRGDQPPLFLDVPASRTGAETALNMVFRLYPGGAVDTTHYWSITDALCSPDYCCDSRRDHYRAGAPQRRRLRM